MTTPNQATPENEESSRVADASAIEPSEAIKETVSDMSNADQSPIESIAPILSLTDNSAEREPAGNNQLLPQRPQASPLDAWSSRLSAWAQVGTLLVLTIGYFFTVRPAFQLQLLQEQTSKLQLERNTASAALNATLAKQISAEETLAAVNASLNRAESERRTLEAELKSTRIKAEVSDEEAARSRRDVATTARELERSQWRMFATQLNMKFIDLTVLDEETGFAGPSRLTVDTEGEFISTAARNWTDPYKVLSRALDDLEKQEIYTQLFPKTFVGRYRYFVERNRRELTCEQPPVNAMRQTFLLDLHALKSAAISPGNAARTQPRPSTISKLQQEYFDRVVELRRQCANVVDTFTSKYRASKTLDMEAELRSGK